MQGRGEPLPPQICALYPTLLCFSASQQNEKHVRGGAEGQGFMGCFIGDDIKHFNFKFSVVFISSLLLLLFPYSHAAERQSR